MSYGFIYLSMDREKNMFYVGKRVGDPDYGSNKKYFGSGTIVKAAVAKRPGSFARIIIETTVSEVHAREREQYWLDFFDAVNDPEFYNLCARSDGGKSPGFNKGKPKPEGFGQKISDALKGRKRPEETKIAMRGPRGPRIKGRNKYILQDSNGNVHEVYGRHDAYEVTGLSSRMLDRVLSGTEFGGWKNVA